MNKKTLDITTEDKKCVYLHRDSQGVVRYVGSGNLQRPYDKGKRSKSWNNLFGEGDLLDEEKLQKAIEALAEIKLKYKGEYYE